MKKQHLPSLAKIHTYWTTHGGGVFVHVDPDDDPACFGCYYDKGLERCHLIAESEGGTNFPSNLVILCRRCHRSAPMVGRIASPMIEWINRREHYYLWALRRVEEECRALSPTLPEDICSIWRESATFETQFHAMAEWLRLGYHPGGELFATMAATFHAMVKLRSFTTPPGE